MNPLLTIKGTLAVGFILALAIVFGAFNGLNGMAERLRQLGGDLKIESSPGAGFSLQAWMPLAA